MARHPVDLLSLTFGVLFTVTGLVMLFGRIESLRIEWVLPAAAVILGVLLIGMARSVRAVPDDQTTDA
jgi:hypothetical protein